MKGLNRRMDEYMIQITNRKDNEDNCLLMNCIIDRFKNKMITLACFPQDNAHLHDEVSLDDTNPYLLANYLRAVNYEGFFGIFI